MFVIAEDAGMQNGGARILSSVLFISYMQFYVDLIDYVGV